MSPIYENEKDAHSDNETDFLSIEQSFLQEFSDDGEGEEDDSDSELDSEFEGWDDETTLVAKLQDKCLNATQLSSLV